MELARIGITTSGRDRREGIPTPHHTARESLMMMFLNTQVKLEQNRVSSKICGL